MQLCFCLPILLSISSLPTHIYSETLAVSIRKCSSWMGVYTWSKYNVSVVLKDLDSMSSSAADFLYTLATLLLRWGLQFSAWTVKRESKESKLASQGCCLETSCGNIFLHVSCGFSFLSIKWRQRFIDDYVTGCESFIYSNYSRLLPCLHIRLGHFYEFSRIISIVSCWIVVKCNE